MKMVDDSFEVAPLRADLNTEINVLGSAFTTFLGYLKESRQANLELAKANERAAIARQKLIDLHAEIGKKIDWMIESAA